MLIRLCTLYTASQQNPDRFFHTFHFFLALGIRQIRTNARAIMPKHVLRDAFYHFPMILCPTLCNDSLNNRPQLTVYSSTHKTAAAAEVKLYIVNTRNGKLPRLTPYDRGRGKVDVKNQTESFFTLWVICIT